MSYDVSDRERPFLSITSTTLICLVGGEIASPAIIEAMHDQIPTATSRP